MIGEKNRRKEAGRREKEKETVISDECNFIE